MSAESCSCNDPPVARHVEAVVTLHAFLDFVLTAGPERLKLAAPPGPQAYDFYDGLVPVLQRAHELGRLADLEGDWLEKDARRGRIYPVLARAYAEAARTHGMGFRRPTPRMLRVGPLDVLVEPHAVWSDGRGGSDVSVCERRPGSTRSGAKPPAGNRSGGLVGLHGGFVDLQAGPDLTLGVSGWMDDATSRSFFEAEALSFAAMRRAR